MSKPLTGVAMMILFEQGKWRLDDRSPIRAGVQELKVMVADDGSHHPRRDMRRPPTMREIIATLRASVTA